ncbi:MAG: RNA 3'-terminal phosphate cyclase [Candidatus Obscuribacterales bacterium]
MTLTIDGSFGEGGGQIIRTSLALSVVTGTPFHVHKIRAGREKPGLRNQHLTAVMAAAQISDAEVDGAFVGSTELHFRPGKLRGGKYNFAIGTAGSTTLVLQTVLPALMLADEASELSFEGGTHNPKAPPFDFVQKAFLPQINFIGPKVSAQFLRYGFYPPGGGKWTCTIEPARQFRPLTLLSRSKPHPAARALVVKLPTSIGDRELTILKSRCKDIRKFKVEESDQGVSPGNVLIVDVPSQELTEVISGIGERGLRAETLAEQVATEFNAYMKADVPVGEHLADQLLLPLALAAGGSYKTVAPSLHTTTNIEIIKKFLQITIDLEQENERQWRISVESGLPH